MDTAKVINIRVRRAKSWVERATTLGNLELAEKFIFYWIAFNALYGQPKYLKEKNEKVPGEFSDIKNFLNLVIPHDKEGKIRAILSSRRKQVDDLLGNKFLMDPCWKFWKKAGIFSRNERSRVQCSEQISGSEMHDLFARLYVLRKQIFHGCSTLRGEKNRKTLENAEPVLSEFVSLFCKILIRVGGQKSVSLKTLPYPPSRN